MSEALTVGDMERLLLAEPPIIAIHRDKPYAVPKANPLLWSAQERDYAQGFIGRLEDYLGAPYIEDNFGHDHDSRIKWKTEMIRKYEWFADFYPSNALKGNSFHSVDYSMSSIQELINLKMYHGTNVGQFSQLVQEIQKDAHEVFGKYMSMTVQDKITAARRVKQKVFELLTFLAEQMRVS